MRSLEHVPFSRYLRLYNVLRICNVRPIPTYKVYQPCDYDDVEICNPLGSKSSIHKLVVCTCDCPYSIMKTSCSTLLGFFYFSLGNISPEYRSKLSSIYLVAIAKQKYISVYGMEAILAPFLKDIAKLVSLSFWPTLPCPRSQSVFMVLNSTYSVSACFTGEWFHISSF